MLRCVSLRVLAASCSLPPSGGRPRAAARCAALRRGRGLLRCFGRCGGLAFRSAGGRCPPRRCPAVVRCALLPLGLLRFAPAAVALGLRGLASLLPPSRSPAAALVAAVAARRARSLAPAARRRLRRRRRSSAWGAARCPPAPLVPASLRPRGLRRVVSAPRRPSPVAAVRLRLGSPPRASAPLRRLAAVGRPRGGFWRPLRRPPFVALCAPPRGVWGLRRCGGAFFRGCCGALLRPRCSSALPSAAASFARCCRAPPAAVWLRPRVLVCLAFGCGLLRTLPAALLPRGLFAPSAHFVVQGEIGCKAQPQAQHIVPTIHLIYHIQASSAKLELFCRIAGTASFP